jgi:hypothetical protein
MYADSVHAAYRELLKNQLGSAVCISDLAKRAGMSISEMRHWVDAEARAGRAILDVGHWPSATPEQRSGAIEFLGEKRLLVRFPRATPEPAQTFVCTNSWVGRIETPCTILKETRKRFLVRVEADCLLTGRRLLKGREVYVPKYAVRGATPTREPEIIR